MIRCLPHGRFCQLPASRTTRHAHRHCCSPGRCAATCLTSQPHQARLCDTKRNNIPSAASASRSPHAATHGRLGPTPRLVPPHARCHRYTPIHAHCHPYTPLHAHGRRFTPSHARCHRHTPPHGRLMRHATLTAVTTRRHARGRCHTPPISRCHRHWHRIAAVLHAHSPLHARCHRHTPPRSRSSPHAITRAAIATRGRSLAAIATRRSTAQHGPWPVCCMFSVRSLVTTVLSAFVAGDLFCTVSRDYCTVRVWADV